MAKYEIKDGVGIIPEWILELEDEAFRGCLELSRVIVPKWVR